MEVYVDPVRIWLLGVSPAIIFAAFLLVQSRITGWRRILVRSNTLVHATAYLLLIQFVYVSGSYSGAGFFLFPADGLVRLIHFDKFSGLVSLILVCGLWGWVFARAHNGLWRIASEWHVPSSLADHISMSCAVIVMIMWLRYLVVYPLLAAPSLYRPLNIYQHVFALDILMINWLFPIFLIGVISAIMSTRKLRLLSMNAIYVIGIVVLIPITNVFT